jgi:decaprenylphospho-beta-D-ribofuranose 2-oxidase
MPEDNTPQLSGWGRIFGPGRELLSENLERLTRNAVLSRGLGRSYGDSALPPPDVLDVAGTRLADRILGFDEDTGRLHVEAGISLQQLNRVFMPRLWFVPVSPGTSFVTVGGMVAADVHGKNHHVAGCFGAHVEKLLLRLPDGQVRWCASDDEPELFGATIGGMGLTGHILEVVFTMRRIPSPWVEQETERFGDIDAFVAGLKDASANWPMTMGWLDCLQRGKGMGRGILYRGRWASIDEAPKRFPTAYKTITAPFQTPSWLLNGLTMRLFNNLLFYKHMAGIKRGIVHPEAFWYPLDRVHKWNLLYGSRGFTQYQCVLPDSAGPGAARRFLEVLTTRGGASFLCVIKDCGPQGQGVLSFPQSGISIALDIPVRDNINELVGALNRAVIAEGGRIYLAKDRFTTADDFALMEPRLARFFEIRDRWDPQRRLRSAQSVRLFGDPASGPTTGPAALPPPDGAST